MSETCIVTANQNPLTLDLGFIHDRPEPKSSPLNLTLKKKKLLTQDFKIKHLTKIKTALDDYISNNFFLK